MKKLLILITFMFFVISQVFSVNNHNGLLMGTKKLGVFKKHTKSKVWVAINNGLPRVNGDFPRVRQIYPVNNHEYYCILDNHGVYYTKDGGYLWVERNNGLPLTFIKSKTKKYFISKITSFSIHPKYPENLLLTTKFNIFFSNDGGESWHEWKLFQRKSNFFIASAFVPIEELNAMIGTAYNGLFAFNFHEDVKLFKGSLPKEPYDKWQNIFFHEEIQSILISRYDYNMIYVGTGFGNGLWFSSTGGRRWGQLDFKVKEDFFNLLSIQELSKDKLLIETDHEYYYYNRKSKEIKSFEIKKYFSQFPSLYDPVYLVKMLDKDTSLHLRRKNNHNHKSKYYERASGKNSIYVTAYRATQEYFEKNLQNMKLNNINSVIIEFKDDYGRVMYDSKLPIVKEVGSRYKVINSKKMISYLKKNDIYIIARVIVFKDKNLYNYKENKFAIWDKTTQAPWKGIKKEYWVDPYSDFVQDYNLEIALELQKLGIDEIQFDYIRFPTDGLIGNCYYRYRIFEMTHVDAVASFLYKARELLNIPISIDVYGFNSWYRMGKVMGQDIETLSEFVDVISPMLYPSHFGDYFLKHLFPDEHQRAEKIIFLGSKRCSIIANNKVVIRPYLQAFNYKSPGYGKRYIEVQIKGAKDSGASGFSLWNPSANYSVYYKVEQPEN